MEITSAMQKAALAAFDDWRSAPLGIGNGEVVNRILSAALALAAPLAEPIEEDLTPLMALQQTIAAAGGAVPSISHAAADPNSAAPMSTATEATDQTAPIEPSA